MLAPLEHLEHSSTATFRNGGLLTGLDILVPIQIQHDCVPSVPWTMQAAIQIGDPTLACSDVHCASYP